MPGDPVIIVALRLPTGVIEPDIDLGMIWNDGPPLTDATAPVGWIEPDTDLGIVTKLGPPTVAPTKPLGEMPPDSDF